jgi:hypothetical protein
LFETTADAARWAASVLYEELCFETHIQHDHMANHNQLNISVLGLSSLRESSADLIDRFDPIDLE